MTRLCQPDTRCLFSLTSRLRLDALIFCRLSLDALAFRLLLDIFIFQSLLDKLLNRRSGMLLNRRPDTPAILTNRFLLGTYRGLFLVPITGAGAIVTSLCGAVHVIDIRGTLNTVGTLGARIFASWGIRGVSASPVRVVHNTLLHNTLAVALALLLQNIIVSISFLDPSRGRPVYYTSRYFER